METAKRIARIVQFCILAYAISVQKVGLKGTIILLAFGAAAYLEGLLNGE